MQVKIIFILVMAALALIDWKTRIVPNLIIFPAMAIGLYFTQNWIWALLMFTIGVILSCYNPSTGVWEFEDSDSLKMEEGNHLIYGGDVKLMAMIGIFLGIKAIAVVIFTAIFISIYRCVKYQFYSNLAVTPFAFAVSLLFLW
ncbi:MAG: prepilin peptidase [Bacteroidales bacterium]|nr:prepilin peptidase [Bacteroidales bacterium]